MSYLLKAKKVDIMLLAEGTYPYIRGGVSSWIHQLISGLSDLTFGIVFIGSRAEDYGEVQYDFPPNLKHIEIHYLFDTPKYIPTKRKGDKAAFKMIRRFYSELKESQVHIPDAMKDIEFYMKNLTMKDFLYSKESWNFISETYEKNCPELPFIDYFWTLRNMHAPVWKIASIVGNMPNCRVLHSPSTGYAGFLGFLASNDKKIPFILTEHGIYTRERKIDMLSANWITFNRLALLKNEPEEFNYIKKMWVNFFEKIGKLSYEKADYIISLYPGAKDIQIEFGADSNKTIVIPNGVDMKRLNSLVQKREGIPPIITLIGRVVSIKDIKTFIRAIAIVKKSMPNIEGWIAGPTDEDEDYAQECFDMVDFFDLKENVKFLGFQKIDDILPKSGLLTLTSISEGMPLVILEGFAAGLPCIATDVGSCSDLIYGALDDEDKEIGEAGAVTTIANPSALAENYIKFLSDENLWKKAQKNGLLRVEKYYQDHFFLDNYKNLYSKAI